METTDSDYRVRCDICGVSIVARNKDDIDRIEYLRSLEDPNEFITCSICAYNKETDSAAVCLVQEFEMSTIPVTAIVSAITESGVPSSVLGDESKMSILQSTVRKKILKIRVSKYSEQTDHAASAIESSTNYSSTRVPKGTVVREKLLNSGIPADIIQSKNTNDKLLVAELVKIVKQKLRKVESEQVSPLGVSVDDYDSYTEQAASAIERSTNYSSTQVPNRVVREKLLNSGIPADIIQSKNINDKLLVAELVKIVKRKLRKVESEQVSPLGVSVDDYNSYTDQAASAIERSTNYSSTQVPNRVVREKLLNSGIPADIIQSENTDDKLLVAELIKIVKRKLRKVESEQVSPLGVSVDDYNSYTDQAASAIERSTNYSSTQVPNRVVREKLLNSGIPADIIQSKNINDKLLVAELVKIVKRKLRKVESEQVRTVASSFKHDQSLSRDERITKARQYANRMALPDKKGVFRASVCIVCDRHIIGVEEVCYLTNVQLKKNVHRIGVKSYNDHYTKVDNGGYPELPLELIKQYEVGGLEGLLLSRRSQRIEANGSVKYESCKCCFDSCITNVKLKSPPKFAIANGFVIGQIPRVFKINRDGIEEEVVVEKEEINDIVRAMLAPTRAYGYTFSYFAGAQQSIQGQFMFYEVDQTLMASVYKSIQESGANPHVHIVLGGRFTPSQKQIIRKKTAVNTELVTKLLTWFKQKSGHKGFEDLEIGKECPQPIRDEEVGEDFELDKERESQYDGGTYYFSSANTPAQDTGVFGTELKFTKSLLERTPPTLLAYGGDYKGGRDLRLEDIIPTAFPWGLGGPSMEKRRNKISLELTFAHYGRLSLDQFMKGDFCLLVSHMLDRRLSYTSGKLKCRSNIDGVPLAEKISRLTIKDLEDVVSGDDTNVIANQLLTSVSASCKAMGHTSEAAAHWRRIYFALSDRYGLNAFMLTITPNDLVSFTVRVIALAGEEHTMPSLDSSEEQCIADFNLRKKTRLDFPGACSLNFQSVIQIVLEVLLGWDPSRRKGSEDGIFGELDAWGMTVEEQARKTLHAHWLLWSKKLAKMREDLFKKDGTVNDTAKEAFCAQVDKVMSASYTDNEWEVEHKCGTKGKVSEVFKQCDFQVLRDARHKILCQDICGKVMECKECHEKISTQDIINLALNEWHRNALKDDETSARNLTFPLSKERLDIAMYRASCDKMSGCYKDDKFWGNEDVRRILQLSGDNEHCALHGPRCFKKGQECTSGSFPQASWTSTGISIDEQEPVLKWYLLKNGDIKRTAPWLILPKRPLGCQYLNTHNVPISTIFGCNSNVIIGDPSNTFYLTLYSSKSTQTEDSEKKERIMKKLIRRLKRLQIEREQHAVSGIEDDKGDFAQGLSMVLSAMNASTSRDVVSSPMAHYLVAKGGERFSASHEPKHLLIHQMEETLDGRAVNYTLRRTNKTKVDGTVVRWPDSSSHDYLYRPNNLVDMEMAGMDSGVNFEDMCAYEFTEYYEKNFFSFKDMDADNQDIIAPGTEETTRYRFIEGHPGREFAYIEKLKLPAIVVVSLPEGKLCLIKDLELGSDTPSDAVEDKREDYAKMALMMFYPFRELDDLKTGDKYWPTFDRERKKYEKDEETAFWKTGFEILQNIDDREMMMQSDHRTRARDPVQKGGKEHVEEVTKKSKGNTINDISFFCDDEESIDSDIEDDDEGLDGRVKWTHNVLMDRSKNITDDRIISARIASKESIFQSSDGSLQNAQEEGTGNIDTGEEFSDWFRNRSYPTLLRFISGTLVGTTNYDDVYGDELFDDISDDEDMHAVTQDDDLSQNGLDTETCNVPTLVGTARKVAREDKMKLDKKQYIAYEIIACTFLLQLVEEGRDDSSILGRYLGSAVGSTTTNDMDQLVKHLKARGGMEQLLMFLTGPAGAGKSTAVKVAQRFCFEFCAAVSVMWYDETFYFTACSGSAAAIFGGITIHSAIKLNGKITDKARQAWKARILVVDEISYYSDNDLKKTDRKLKDLNGIPNKPFGGQSIIFCGDFRQFEAIKAKHLLYDRNGSQLWENSINCVIILENIHRFKDDPDFGEMLTRLWRDDLTNEDREKINTRVVGRNGVTLPSTFDGDVVYACSTNKERNAIQAGIFRDHIRDTHPSVTSTDLPPQHTIIIEAVIQSTKSKEAPTSIGSFTSNRIIHTCGDADCVVNDTKFIDPSLRLYVGAHCMCTVDNKRLKDKVPIGNGTLCRVVGIKLNDHAPSHRWQNWDGRKVSTVSAKHVDWVEFEYHPKSKTILKLEGEIKELEWELKINQEAYEAFRTKKRTRTTTTSCGMMSDPIIRDIMSELDRKKLHLKKEQQSRRFKLEPQTSSATLSFKLHDLSRGNETARCKMTQIPVVLADAITGHKLQGMTIPHVIIASWGYFAKNWPYVVLSRSTTFKGLYLFETIDMDKSFAPSRDLVEYLRRAEDLQDHIIQMRDISIAELANDENNGIVL